MSKPVAPAITEFDRQLASARDHSITTLRQAADHRRVEHLANNIHAMLQGESRADATFALTKALAHGCSDLPPNEALTFIAVIIRLISLEIAGDDA
jgi:hypothetical protein